MVDFPTLDHANVSCYISYACLVRSQYLLFRVGFIFPACIIDLLLDVFLLLAYCICNGVCCCMLESSYIVWPEPAIVCERCNAPASGDVREVC